MSHHGGEPVVTPTDSVAYRAAEQAIVDSFGKASLSRPKPKSTDLIPNTSSNKATIGILPPPLVGIGFLQRATYKEKASSS